MPRLSIKVSKFSPNAIKIFPTDDYFLESHFHKSPSFPKLKLSNNLRRDADFRVTPTEALQLPPGEYKVTVSIGTDLPPGWKEGDTVPPPKIKLPDQYGQRVRTPLTATVAEGQSEPINFTIK